jgi:cephalosporin hydroxylase
MVRALVIGDPGPDLTAELRRFFAPLTVTVDAVALPPTGDHGRDVDLPPVPGAWDLVVVNDEVGRPQWAAGVARTASKAAPLVVGTAVVPGPRGAAPDEAARHRQESVLAAAGFTLSSATTAPTGDGTGVEGDAHDGADDTAADGEHTDATTITWWATRAPDAVAVTSDALVAALDGLDSRLPGDDPRVLAVVRSFNRLWYHRGDLGDRFDLTRSTWMSTSWLGLRAMKAPTDAWSYQEIIAETRPDLLVETGSMFGGSALFFAGIMDLLGHGRVISIDIAPDRELPSHDRVTWLTRSSVDPATLDMVRTAAGGGTVMVVLDSDHSAGHVLRELDLYAPLVTPGSYLVVEDSNINGRPILPWFGPGPGEALDSWVPRHPEFEVDASRERFLLTFAPGGWLRRVA